MPDLLDQLSSTFKNASRNAPVLAIHRIHNPQTVTTPEENESIETQREETQQQGENRQNGTAKISSIQTQHLGAFAKIYVVIEWLKQCDDPQTLEEIKRGTNVDIEKLPELMQRLHNNDKITVFDGKYAYKPIYQIRSKSDLLALVKRLHSEEGGLDCKDLQNTWSGIPAAIEALVEENSIICIRNKTSPRVLYYNLEPPVKVDEQFKDLWHKTVIPTNPTDLQKVLIQVGLKSKAQAEKEEEDKKRLLKEEQAELKRKKRNKGKRKLKLTNTHLGSHIDLSQDYVAGTSNSTKKIKVGN